MIIGTIPEGMKSLFVDLLTNGMRVRGISGYKDIKSFKSFFCDYFEETIFHCMFDESTDSFLIEVKRDKTILVVKLTTESEYYDFYNLATFSLPEENPLLPPILKDVGLAATECFNGIASWNLLSMNIDVVSPNLPDNGKDPSKDDDKKDDNDKDDSPDFDWL